MNLDSFEDKIKALNKMHLDIGKNKSNSSLHSPDLDRDTTHNLFLGQKVPLSERNQGETDSNSASNTQKRVSIFLDSHGQPIQNKDDLKRHLEEQKRRSEGGLGAVSIQEQSPMQPKTELTDSGGKEVKEHLSATKRKGSEDLGNELLSDPIAENYRLAVKKITTNATEQPVATKPASKEPSTAAGPIKGKIFNSKSQAALAASSDKPAPKKPQGSTLTPTSFTKAATKQPVDKQKHTK